MTTTDFNASNQKEKSANNFVLDERLRADTVAVGDWPLSRVLLMNDSQYPWLILVPRRAGVSEIYQLDGADQQQLMLESCALSAAMAEHFQADKMNVANLGNIVAQLHLHHIARRKNDPAWPGPVWGKLPPQPYDAAALAGLREQMQVLLGGQLGWQSLPG